MISDVYKARFIEAARTWICDGYSIDFRYVERRDLAVSQLWEASLILQPLPPPKDMSFRIENPVIATGQRQIAGLTASELIGHVQNAMDGRFEIDKQKICLTTDNSLNYYSEMMRHDRWFSPLHIQVTSNQANTPPSIDTATVDTHLRLSDPAFDGMADLYSWLGLTDQQLSRTSPLINIQILPPADLVVAKCGLKNDSLSLSIHALSHFDTKRLKLAIRAFPGVGLASRRQVATQIKWQRVVRGIRQGKANIKIKNADSVLVMLIIGEATVRRQWFIDPAKARNNRLIAVQLFDKELRMIRQAILQPVNAASFETGIAALLFLMGFSSAVMIETDAPDLVVTTPGGKLAIVECTTRIADFHAKLGKLIDRRGALTKSLQSSGHSTNVIAVLVCALPRDQIAMHEIDVTKHNAVLITQEGLSSALDQTRLTPDPDKLLDDALASLNAANKPQLLST